MRRSRPRRPTTAHAADDRNTVLKHRLPNGLGVILCPRPQLSQSYVAAYFGVGSRHETPHDNGITHILEHMLFRGTENYADATALNAAAEDFGGFLEGATYRDHLVLATGCHPSAVAQAIAILGELVLVPRYRGMAVEKSILHEELLETVDKDGRMIDLDNIAHACVFGDHGLGLPIEGTISNLDRIDQRELEQHRERFLVGSNAVVSVAGPLDPDRVLRQVERAFGSMRRGAPPSPDVPELAADDTPLLRYVRDASSQVDIRISFRAVPIQDPRYPALVMLGRLLSDGLASRMHADLVDRRGLAYSLHAGLTTYSDCGLFEFEVTVAPDRAAEAVSAILDFARAAGRFRFNTEELSRARRRYRYGIEFMSDSPADLVSWYGRAALFGVEREMERLGGQMMRVEEASIRAAARDVFRRDGLVITAAGELARGEWARVRRKAESWG
jgi:predicted Zn-dependent peptidase